LDVDLLTLNRGWDLQPQESINAPYQIKDANNLQALYTDARIFGYDGLIMKTKIIAASILIIAANVVFAEETKYAKAKVSYEDFKGLVTEVEAHRASRLIDFDTFLKMSKEPNVIILDSRSAFRYERIHLKGATHLAFTDFTQDTLRKTIPSPDTKILIYCNNNFEGNQVDFTSKTAGIRPVISLQDNRLQTAQKSIQLSNSQFAAEAKPLMMALNVPTYINLYGYGYHNVYELDELVNVKDPRVKFEGTEATK
jgi:rhodanese-related sulfurtransferase